MSARRIRLGDRQLARLRGYLPTHAGIVPRDAVDRRLIELGLIERDGLIQLTPAGLRACADAIEAGRLPGLAADATARMRAQAERAAKRREGGGT